MVPNAEVQCVVAVPEQNAQSEEQFAQAAKETEKQLASEEKRQKTRREEYAAYEKQQQQEQKQREKRKQVMAEKQAEIGRLEGEKQTFSVQLEQKIEEILKTAAEDLSLIHI